MSAGVLVMGGTGTFGRRLVRGLIAATDLDVVIAGRNLEHATALADEMQTGQRASRARAVRMDVNTVAPDQLRHSGAFAVVDAAGPFQGGNYRLAKAAIAAGLHYLDLADARDFVAGFPHLDAGARNAGVVALTGASSTPALSNAVLDRLTQEWRSIDTVEIAISPGNRAPRGVAVVRSILSYAGRPVRVFHDGRWMSHPGWGMTTRRTIRGIGKRWASLCDTPDLDIVPQRFGVRRSAVFRAGLELPILHLGLFAASLSVRVGILPSLAPFSRTFRTAADLFTPFGTDRGGMVVAATGLALDGEPICSTWTLIAEAGDGPVIPTLPALAAVRALADGRLNRPGAYVCAGVLDLGAIEREFRPYRITSHIETERPNR